MKLGPLLLALFLAQACGSPSKARFPVLAGPVDAPYQLQEDDDLEETRKLFDSLRKDDSTREELRGALAKEYQRRIQLLLHRKERDLAFTNYTKLLRLWSPKEQEAQPSPLRKYSKETSRFRKNFSQSGNAIEAITSLVVLKRIAPQKAQQYQQEIEEILAYSDELGIAKDGKGAHRARQITILETVAQTLQSEEVIAPLIRLYQKRQQAIQSAFRRDGANYELIRVHGLGALNTTHNIVAFLAQSGRISEALKAIEPISGIGDDTELRALLRSALASQSPESWVKISEQYQNKDPNLGAALALCQIALRTSPENSPAAFCAGNVAKRLGNSILAIRYYKQGLKSAPTHAEANHALAQLFEERVSTLAYRGRPLAAKKQLKEFESFHALAKHKLAKPVKPDLASAYSAMARGLLSSGELSEAKGYLNRSLSLRKNLPSLEYLGTISLRQGRSDEAVDYYAKAIALEGKGFAQLFEQTRLRRLQAEAKLVKGDLKQANTELKTTLLRWVELLHDYELSDLAAAEAQIEMGKLEFLQGNREVAINYFFRSLSSPHLNASSHADIASFLLLRNAYAFALEIYLDALGNSSVSNYYKIYMSLWILAESKHLHQEPESHALAYLQSREGSLWSEELAQYAVGKVDREKLEALATTRGRRAELQYYAAVVGPENPSPAQRKRLLNEVVRGNMVLFFEYEMAQHRLSAP